MIGRTNSVVPGLACALLASTLAAQDSKSASIEGTVTNAVTGEPLVKAHVGLRMSAVITDRKYGATTIAEGKFSIRPIEPGIYDLAVELPGFLFARSHGRNVKVEVRPGDTVRDLKLKMLPHGVISGRVLDGNGDPVEHATVEAMSGPITRSDQMTDEKGEFRLSALPPGKYLIRATPAPRAGPPEVRTDDTKEEYFGATYYPGSLNEEGASAVEARAGAEVTGIEIRLARTPIVRVSGVVTGRSVGAKTVWLADDSRHARHDIKVTGGSFTIWRLPRGKYRLTATGVDSAGRSLSSAPEDIEVVDSNIDDLKLAVVLPLEISGRIAWDSDPPDGEHHRAKLRLQSVWHEDGPDEGAIDPDGTFRLKKVAADRYRVRIEGMPENVYVKSVRLGVAEMPDRCLDLLHGSGGAPLLVTLSTAGAQISGVARDSTATVADLLVALLADGPNGFTLFLTTRTSADGSYSFRGLASGTYKLLVLDDDDANDLVQNSSVGSYEQLAEKVHVSEGDRLIHDLAIPE